MKSYRTRIGGWRPFVSGLLLASAGLMSPLHAQAPSPTPPDAPLAEAPATDDATPPATGTLDTARVDTFLDGLVPYLMAQGDLAGAVVTVVENGRVVTERGFGFSDVDKRTPVDPETTLFRPGSISKL
ncbi:MAG: serine hydrolase, partial [Luteimonas sp.]